MKKLLYVLMIAVLVMCISSEKDPADLDESEFHTKTTSVADL